MKVPPLLEASYRSDHKLDYFVSRALARIDGHIAANKMVFFPEYTDHSITHIEQTLQTAFDLASAPARGILSPSDAAVLVVSVALHDFGMYLTREGFQSLISPGTTWKGVQYFDTKSWHSLWDDFYAEAMRFDGRKLRQLFGDNYLPVRPLPSGGSDWRESDYLLIGEFLRRHHPRLAHEIALYGLPAKDGTALIVCPSDSDEERFLADICGLVARSHGMDLRRSLSYLTDVYGNQVDPRRVHPSFLGALLRIADYFQIQSSRAPTERTEVTSFRSPISENEWKVHQSIHDIHNTSGDPEAVVVNAKPPDVESFLRLQEWLTGLQKELDHSWAVLGEVFGLQANNSLNLLGLRIRRIKSNLDDSVAFAKTVSYIPARISFEAANADLLKLLVIPLYGNNPGIGLRELFQNAVDAVREFEDALSRHPELAAIERYNQDADVLLEVRCDKADRPEEIIVTDRGIGMTADTLRDYFLKAGASFRRSDTWRREYEDESGHSRVLRTGRFGVGALAAFLLGDRIEVTTRHAFAQSDWGLRFSAQLDDEAISLVRLEAPVGTKISIKVPEVNRRHLASILPSKSAKSISFGESSGHYFLKQPSLKRVFSTRKDLLPQAYLPQPTDGVSPRWRCFSTESFEKIFWTFRSGYPHISCNGIVVVEDGSDRERIAPNIKMPHVSVFDKDGRFPTNLQRTGLQTPLPIKDDLLRSIGEDLLIYALITAPKSSEDEWYWREYAGFEARYEYYQEDDWGRWLTSSQSFVLNEPSFIRDVSPKQLVIAVGGHRDRKGWGDKIRRALPVDTLLAHYYPGVLAGTNPRIKGIFQAAVDSVFRPVPAYLSRRETFIPDAVLNKIKKLKPGRAVSSCLVRLESESSPGPWRHLRRSADAPVQLLETIRSLPVDAENPVLFTIAEVIGWHSEMPKGPLYDRWMEIVGVTLIPYEAGARQALEGRAATHVPELVETWRTMAAEMAKSKQIARELRGKVTTFPATL
jgi:hypothetical protein